MFSPYDRWLLRGTHDECEAPEPCRCVACREEQARVRADLAYDLARESRDDE